ncbi:MAG: hypothetical protein AB8G16_01390 [Gammaproteobacteria bacterium]
MRFIFGLALAAATTPTAFAVDYYAGIDAAYLRIPVADANFGGLGLKLRAGATHTSGWGVEVQTLAGIGDDSVGTLTLQADNLTAAFLRYETNQGNDFRFFAVAGYAATSLSFEGPSTDGLEDSLSGFAYGFGAQEKLEWLPSTTAVLEFNSFFHDSNVDIWAVSFGLRYDF